MTHCNANAKIPNFRPLHAAPLQSAALAGRPPSPPTSATLFGREPDSIWIINYTRHNVNISGCLYIRELA